MYILVIKLEKLDIFVPKPISKFLYIFDNINDSKSKYLHKYVPKSVQNDSKSA